MSGPFGQWIVEDTCSLSISAKELSLIPLATSICDKDWRLKRIVLHFVLHQISIAILQPTCIDLQQALGIGSAVFLSVEFSQKNFDDFFFFFFYQTISLAPLFYQIIYSFSAVSEFSHIFTGYSSMGCDQDHTVYFFCCLFIYYISVLWILLPVNRLQIIVLRTVPLLGLFRIIPCSISVNYFVVMLQDVSFSKKFSFSDTFGFG